MVGHLRAFVLPLTAAVIVPSVLLVRSGWQPAGVPWPRLVLGVVLVGGGLAMLAWTVALFARVGRGTLAPWEPTRKMVIVGPYAHVRNPMITGVFAVLCGEALLSGDPSVAIWCGLFLLINHVYFLLSEEPGLAKRFGAEYAEYKQNVPRWIPRFRAWRPVRGRGDLC